MPRYDEILEYPYYGTITRVVAGKGLAKDTTILVYEGEMDEHMAREEEGHTLQTSAYIVSIPLTKTKSDEWIVPKKGDLISITRYGETHTLTVDNADPSQLGGVSIYASRKSW